MELIAQNVTKYFNEHLIFKEIEFGVKSGQCIAIVGPNGSGKTTLVRILSHLMPPSEGKVIYKNHQGEVKREYIHQYISLIGPYLALYDQLTAMENLTFFARMRGIKEYKSKIYVLMQQFGLAGREDDLVRTYSSGMKQRLKYVFALMSDPDVLFVDEPRANLDEEGIRTVYEVLSKRRTGKIVILATNDAEDLKLADRQVRVHA